MVGRFRAGDTFLTDEAIKSFYSRAFVRPQPNPQVPVKKNGPPPPNASTFAKSVVLPLSALLLSLLSPSLASAATDAWAGTTSNLWNASTNWSDTLNAVPASGDSITFGATTGTGGTILTDNLMTPGTYSVAGITFSAGSPAYTINPGTVGTNGFTLTGGITNNSTSLQTINDLITTTAVRTVTLGGGGGNITLGGNINGTGGGFTATGAGTLSLTGNISSTGVITGTSGATIILSGSNGARPLNTDVTNVWAGSTLQLQANSGNTVGGISYALGPEATTADELTLNNGSTLQLRSDSNVTFAGGNYFGGLGGVSPYAGALVTIDVGAITAGNTGNTIAFAPAGTTLLNTAIYITSANNYTLALGHLSTAAVSSSATTDAFVPTSGNITFAGIAGNNTAPTIVDLNGDSAGNSVTGVIGGGTKAVSVVKYGPSTWMLTAANTYTGATTVEGGILNIGNGTSGSLTSGALTFGLDGGIVNFDEANGSSQSMGVLTFGGGDGTVESTYETSGNTTLTFASLAARTVGATGNFVTNGGANGSTNVIKFTSAPTAGALLNVGEFFDGSSYAAYDTGGFVRAYGSSDTGYSAANSPFSSGVNVSLTGNITGQGSVAVNTLNMGANTLGLSSGAAFQASGILVSGNSASTISGGASLSAATSGAELVIRTNLSSDNLTISMPIVANGANALTKSGLGTLTLTGNDTYTGATTIDAGTLILTGNNSGATGATTLDSGATLQLQANSGNIVSGTSFALTSAASGFGAPNTYPGVQTVTVQLRSDTSVTFAGGNSLLGVGSTAFDFDVNDLTGATGQVLTFAPGGFATGNTTLNVTGGNGYSLNVGSLGMVSLGLTAPSSLTLNPTTANLIVAGITQSAGVNGPILVEGSGTTTVTGPIANGSGTVTVASGATLVVAGANTYTGGTILSGGTIVLGNGGTTGSLATTSAITNSGVLAFNRSNAVTQGTDFTAAALSGTGALAQLGSGSLTLNAANTYTGGTTLAAGTLDMSNAAAIGTGALTITGGAFDNTSGAAMTLANNNAQQWNGSFGFVGSNNLSLGTGAVTLGASPTITVSAGNLTVGGAISGVGYGITKAGTGNLVFTAANGYSGSTSVTGGTLTLSGAASINSSSGITINGNGAEFIQNSSTALTPSIVLTNGTLAGAREASAL